MNLAESIRRMGTKTPGLLVGGVNHHRNKDAEVLEISDHLMLLVMLA
jgi:hypothetical protein